MNTELEFIKRKLRSQIKNDKVIAEGSDGSVYFLNDELAVKLYHGEFYYGNNKEEKAHREARLYTEMKNHGIPVPSVYSLISPDTKKASDAIPNWAILMERIHGKYPRELSERGKDIADFQFEENVCRIIDLGYEPVDHYDLFETPNILFDESCGRMVFIDVLRWHHISEPIDYFEKNKKNVIFKGKIKEVYRNGRLLPLNVSHLK